MAKKQTSFRLTPDVRKRLRREAERLGLSLNGTVNVILDRCLPPIDGAPPSSQRPSIAPTQTDPDTDDDEPFKWPESKNEGEIDEKHEQS